MRAKESEDQGKALNDEVAQINKEQDAYNARCGVVTVRPADREAVAACGLGARPRSP